MHCNFIEHEILQCQTVATNQNQPYYYADSHGNMAKFNFLLRRGTVILHFMIFYSAHSDFVYWNYLKKEF